ncbi:MAG: hypothetical protein PHE36_04415 [Novosphingobium sp.]|nr:hypothetical protein [Novosphingobium sp.]
MTAQSEAKRVAEELTEAERNDLSALHYTHHNHLYGGIFDGFTAERIIRFKQLKLARWYVPKGCQAPLAKITPFGLRVHAALKGGDHG